MTVGTLHIAHPAAGTGSWSTIGPYGDDSEITAGNDLTFPVQTDHTVRVVWRAESEGSSATLGKWEGPDA